MLRILNKRVDKLSPLLLQIQEIEKEYKEEIRRDTKEEKEKIREIDEMLRTEEIRGERKEKLL